MEPAFNYERIRRMPFSVRTFTFQFDGWVVGGGGLFLAGLADDVLDWDVIVPPSNWTDAQHLIPYQTPSNTFGGFKLRDADPDGNPIEVDVWAEDVGHFINHQHRVQQVLVQPRYQKILMLV